MILPDNEIIKLLDEKVIEVVPLNRFNIGPTSIDLALDSNILVYESNDVIDLGNIEARTHMITIPDEGYILKPNDFILAATVEKIRLDESIQGFIETKGDIARAGLQVHNCDGHIDPGTNHTITLEIKNQNHIPIVLRKNTLICQIFFFRIEGKCTHPYSGKYFEQQSPSAYRIN